MADGEMAVCFVNGAVRTSEQKEMVELLRKKAQIMIAFGSCSYMGGIPGLANFHNRDTIFERAYHEVPSVDNPDAVVPQLETKVPEGTLTLPEFFDTVKTLDQVLDVDYYLPGCAPPVNLILTALTAILENKLPPKGTVLAPDVALCDECPRKESKPEDLKLKVFKRPFQISIDPEKCLLAQGLLCMGPATRAGCEALCINGNMPCTGCLGPTSRVEDSGAKMLSTIASIIDSKDEEEIESLLDQIVDPLGTFYRYSLPSSILHRRIQNSTLSGRGQK
jgi:F420-non-reducing hydrogenase small subunit